MLTGLDVRCQPFEHLARIADEGGIHLYVLVDLGAVEFSLVVIAAPALGGKIWRGRFPVEFRGSLLRVFGDVDKDRAGTPAVSDQEGFTDRARNVLRF